jgi:hypothetical protein
VLAGEAANLVTQFTKAWDINKFHFAEELAAAAFSSFVVPKHSPLKVMHNSNPFILNNMDNMDK